MNDRILEQTAEKIANEFGIHMTRSQEYIQLRTFQRKKVRVMITNGTFPGTSRKKREGHGREYIGRITFTRTTAKRLTKPVRHNTGRA